ncbi:hypothetical protein QBC41DRAFT_287461 [Cercophora samala]|uniref:Uncharacterized protein n=1 Tax=Cercophora samala TaxID=330535 RepID=A0AA39YUH6_9PEZI|nr:hypothetical protein QBC41DRAFT_287461 [Cercophora samala]
MGCASSNLRGVFGRVPARAFPGAVDDDDATARGNLGGGGVIEFQQRTQTVEYSYTTEELEEFRQELLRDWEREVRWLAWVSDVWEPQRQRLVGGGGVHGAVAMGRGLRTDVQGVPRGEICLPPRVSRLPRPRDSMMSAVEEEMCEDEQHEKPTRSHGHRRHCHRVPDVLLRRIERERESQGHAEIEREGRIHIERARAWESYIEREREWERTMNMLTGED